jgi:hypothetical protein
MLSRANGCRFRAGIESFLFSANTEAGSSRHAANPSSFAKLDATPQILIGTIRIQFFPLFVTVGWDTYLKIAIVVNQRQEKLSNANLMRSFGFFGYICAIFITLHPN